MDTLFSFYINENFVLLYARVILGIVMLYYGIPKIKDLEANARDFDGMGWRPGWVWGTICALLEFFGGPLVILGIFTEIVVFLFAIKMVLGTSWKLASAKKPFSDYSYDLLIIAVALVIMKYGIGDYLIVF